MTAQPTPVIEIGGTHVTAAQVAADSWSVISGSTHRQPLRSAGTAEEILAAVASCANSVHTAAGQRWGVALPGPFDYAQGIGLFEGVAKFEALYGVDVRLVQEIRRVTEITSVPRAPEFIKGVINLRGRIIPVVDLKRKLRLGEVGIAPASRIVVVKIRERLLGLLVDGASQVLKIPISSIDAPPEEVVEKGGDYIRGVAKLERRLIILVDLLKILAVELQAAGSPAGEA